MVCLAVSRRPVLFLTGAILGRRRGQAAGQDRAAVSDADGIVINGRGFFAGPVSIGAAQAVKTAKTVQIGPRNLKSRVFGPKRAEALEQLA
jgi:hypothetical protein